MSNSVVADGRSRLLLPKALRDNLGLQPGATVSAELAEDGVVILRDSAAQVRAWTQRVQASAQQASTSSQELIADRRDAAAVDADQGGDHQLAAQLRADAAQLRSQ